MSSTGAAGVVFDVDGTLVDTTYIHAVCWAEALRRNGSVVPMANVHHAIGMGTDELLDHLLGADRDHGRDGPMREAHSSSYRRHWGNLDALPGARDLLRECSRLELAVVLASSAAPEELEMLRAVIDADDSITAATSSGDAASGKPDPDIVATALDSGGLDPGSSVFVGDSVWDGAAANRAGVRFIGLTCGGTSAADLREAGAVEVWSDPAHLLVHLDEALLHTTNR